MTSTLPEIAAGRRRPEEELAERFRAFGATGPDTAQDIVPSDSEEAASFDSLRARGVIRGASGGFFLDEDALDDLNRRRRGWFYGSAGLIALIAGLLGWRLASARH